MPWPCLLCHTARGLDWELDPCEDDPNACKSRLSRSCRGSSYQGGSCRGGSTCNSIVRSPVDGVNTGGTKGVLPMFPVVVAGKLLLLFLSRAQ